MSDNRQSLSDLAKLTAEPEAPAAEAPAAEAAEAPAAEAPAETVEATEAPETPAAAEAAPAREGRDEGGRGRREKPEDENKDGVLTQGPQIQAVRDRHQPIHPGAAATRRSISPVRRCA